MKRGMKTEMEMEMGMGIECVCVFGLIGGLRSIKE